MTEYQEIEWKESCRDEYLKGLSGYAIVRDGTLFISKDDNGKVIVIIGGKKMLEALSNKIANALGILTDMNLRAEDGKDYPEIVVDKSLSLINWHRQ